MKLSIDFNAGWNSMLESAGRMITDVEAQMHYLHRCCSVGVLHAVRASEIDAHPYIIDVYNKKLPMTFNIPTLEEIKKCKTIHELMRLLKTSPVSVIPEIFAHYYILSCIWKKTKTGADDSNDHTYGNYKCSQVLLFDRLTEDKDPKKGFRFTYNETYAVDNFVTWLQTQNNKYGEFYVTPALPGAHKARVRGGILSPDLAVLDAFEDENFPIVQEYMIAQNNFLTAQRTLIPAAVSQTGKLW